MSLTPDGIDELAGLLRIDPGLLRGTLGGPWSEGRPGPGWGGDFVIFTGRENPRTPDRPLVAIRVDPFEQCIDIGHAVGVPLPNGRFQWALGEPRTNIPYDFDEEPDALRAAEIADELREAINRVADAAMFKGTSW